LQFYRGGDGGGDGDDGEDGGEGENGGEGLSDKKMKPRAFDTNKAVSIV